LQAAPLQGIYSVTKAGLIMLTKVMARECGRQKGARQLHLSRRDQGRT